MENNGVVWIHFKSQKLSELWPFRETHFLVHTSLASTFEQKPDNESTFMKLSTLTFWFALDSEKLHIRLGTMSPFTGLAWRRIVPLYGPVCMPKHENPYSVGCQITTFVLKRLSDVHLIGQWFHPIFSPYFGIAKWIRWTRRPLFILFPYCSQLQI